MQHLTDFVGEEFCLLLTLHQTETVLVGFILQFVVLLADVFVLDPGLLEKLLKIISS